MDWMNLFPSDRKPTPLQIAAYVSSPLLGQLQAYLETSYAIAPTYAYSSCSGQPGWNMKYQKGGRALCTLYPMEGYFIALVVIGSREATAAELLLPTCTQTVQDLFAQARPMPMGRWLMIPVLSDAILDDVKQLIALRRPPR